MTQRNMTINKKKERLKISNINDFKNALKRDGYIIHEFDDQNFKEKMTQTFEVDNSVIERLYNCLEDADITYRADNIRDFIDYIEKMILFENEHNKLCAKISEVKTLIIDRIEYERELSTQDNVYDIEKAIEEIKSNISIIRISKEEKQD